jgi:hypothetical protein
MVSSIILIIFNFLSPSFRFFQPDILIKKLNLLFDRFKFLSEFII